MKTITTNKWLLGFVLVIPIINLVATLITSYFPAGTFNPGTIRALIIGLFFIYFLFNNYPVTRANLTILFFIIYLLFLTLISDNIGRSFYVYLRFFIASLMFPVGYYYINSIHRLKLFYYILLVALSLLVGNMIVANFFKIGSSDYLEESFYFGEYGVNITKNLVVLILTAPVFFILINKKSLRRISIVLFFLAIIFVIIGVKRSALLALLGGALTYLLFTSRKVRSFQIAIVAIFFLIIASPYYYPIFVARYEARQEKVSMTIEELDEDEGRVIEVNMAITRFIEAPIGEKLFGRNLFLGRDLHGSGRARMLHVDYSNMLSGAGLIGLLFFITSYIVIFLENKSYYNQTDKSVLANELFAVMSALLVAQAFLSVGGSVQGIDLRGLILMNLGAFGSTLKRMAYEHRMRLNQISKINE